MSPRTARIAGPRVLEHMVDVVMSFEGERSHQYRILRALKNRFRRGRRDRSVFAMAGDGLGGSRQPLDAVPFRAARTPAGGQRGVPGAGGHAAGAGGGSGADRPAAKSGATPRRAVVGWDSGRLAMLLAVLEARCGLNFSSAEVYLNVAGGYRLSDPAADLAVAAALVSALWRTRLCPTRSVWLGEVSLAGEIRSGRACWRCGCSEAAKLGFRARAQGRSDVDHASAWSATIRRPLASRPFSSTA